MLVLAALAVGVQACNVGDGAVEQGSCNGSELAVLQEICLDHGGSFQGSTSATELGECDFAGGGTSQGGQGSAACRIQGEGSCAIACTLDGDGATAADADSDAMTTTGGAEGADTTETAASDDGLDSTSDADACIDMDCLPGDTCVAGQCVPNELDDAWIELDLGCDDSWHRVVDLDTGAILLEASEYSQIYSVLINPEHSHRVYVWAVGESPTGGHWVCSDIGTAVSCVSGEQHQQTIASPFEFLPVAPFPQSQLPTDPAAYLSIDIAPEAIPTWFCD